MSVDEAPHTDNPVPEANGQLQKLPPASPLTSDDELVTRKRRFSQEHRPRVNSPASPTPFNSPALLRAQRRLGHSTGELDRSTASVESARLTSSQPVPGADEDPEDKLDLADDNVRALVITCGNPGTDAAAEDLVRRLRASHVTVAKAESAAEGLRLFATDEHASLVICDMYPEGGVVEVLRFLAERAAARAKGPAAGDLPPVLLLSFTMDPGVMNPLMERGAYDYCGKPLIPRMLLRRVRDLARLMAAGRAPTLDHLTVPSARGPQRERLTQSLPLPAPKKQGSSEALNMVAMRWKLGLIATERKRASLLVEQKEELEKSVETLQEQLSNFETPIQHLMSEVTNIMSDDAPVTPQLLQKFLQKVVKDLTSNDLYRPKLADFLADTIQGAEAEKSLDPSTAWVLGNFSKVELNASFRPGAHGHSEKLFLHGGEANSNPELMELLRSRNYSVFEFDGTQLLGHVVAMFEDLGLVKRYAIPLSTLQTFLMTLMSKYRQTNPYHTWRHAVDVTQTCYHFVTGSRASRLLSELDVLALMVAAISHDVDHPGRNNQFLIATDNALAQVYNDQSVLENHHAAAMFKVLREERCNIFQNLAPDEMAQVRKAMITFILKTDMANHFEMLGKFQIACSAGIYTDPNRQLTADERLAFAATLLHAADVSNPVKPLIVFKQWAALVLEEFLAQGDEERSLGLPISAMMDRAKQDLASMEVNFIRYIVEPLFVSLVEILPELRPCLDSLHENSDHFKAQIPVAGPPTPKTGTSGPDLKSAGSPKAESPKAVAAAEEPKSAS